MKGDCSNLKNALIDLGENPEVNLLYAISIDDPWYGGIFNFLCTFSFPLGCTSYERKKIRRDSRRYTIFDGVLYRQGIDGVLRRAIDAEEASKVVKQYHDGFCGGHYATDYTTKKILHAGYYWPTLFKDTHAFCKSCENCQKLGSISKHHIMPLNLILVIEIFDCWGIDFYVTFSTVIWFCVHSSSY